MSEFTRRRAIYGVAAGGVAALAGCTGTGDPVPGGNGSDDGDATDAGNDTDGDGGDDGGGDGEVATAVHQVGEPLSGPAWDRTQRRGICVLITEANGDGTRILDEAPEPAREFLAATDFSESVVCYVESVGPTTCHDEVAFDGVGIEDGTLVADATVQGAEDEDVACGEAVTYSAALLRVTSDPLPETARLSVTDGWGETGTVRDGDGVPDR
ncbi:hypothetical protein [Halorubrum tebenquichense]|uniref:Lipoprotein n=1 Tax=Halorubrum tebenquichense DSM 14210 TaxID=1227485 RepID=M0DFG0_9EURY|nr:hypothetical protein [Halorubrum tebenquichense]ELZ34241.1 hypothetical protein C472_13442 [Halorubrum tebenquichense DSM 14210]